MDNSEIMKIKQDKEKGMQLVGLEQSTGRDTKEKHRWVK